MHLYEREKRGRNKKFSSNSAYVIINDDYIQIYIGAQQAHNFQIDQFAHSNSSSSDCSFRYALGLWVSVNCCGLFLIVSRWRAEKWSSINWIKNSRANHQPFGFSLTIAIRRNNYFLCNFEEEKTRTKGENVHCIQWTKKSKTKRKKNTLAHTFASYFANDSHLCARGVRKKKKFKIDFEQT